MPDVLLSVVAQRRGFRAALPATAFAVAGAVLGGLAMFHLGAAYPEQVRAWLDAVPAISPAMIASAGPALAEHPFAALLSAAFSGVPYKVFAAAAAERRHFRAGLRGHDDRRPRPALPGRRRRGGPIDRLAANWLDLRTRSLILAAVGSSFTRRIGR